MSAVGKPADRLLLRLAAEGAHAVGEPGAAKLAVIVPDGRAASADRAAVEALIGAGLAEEDAQGRVTITDAGRARIARLRNGQHPHLAQHADLERRRIAEAGASIEVLVDASESPLAWLARRRGKDGKPLLNAAAVQAGERFRAHVTMAQTIPRTTSNWSDPMGRGQKSAGGVADLADAVIAAQQKVRRALDAVGPELSGVLLDVCAFLKGLEDVERERGWPPRTAKVVLGLALDRLAGHYGLGEMATGRAKGGVIRHWRADDA